MQSTLESRIDLVLKRTPFSGAIDELRRKSGCNIVIDWTALREAHIAGDVPLTLDLKDVTVRAGLEAVLRAASRADGRLVMLPGDELIRISTESALSREVDTRVYSIAGLLPRELNAAERKELDLAVTRLWRSNFHVFAPPWQGIAADPKVGPRRDATTLASEVRDRLAANRPQQIVAAVRAAVPRESWANAGGPGDVRIVGDCLIVTQTVPNQGRIASFLRDLAGAGGSIPRPK